jgi:hypothetical protein
MANLEKVFKQEWDRENPAEWNKIHLYKMGDFWRAYEWSAWLISAVSFNDNVRMTTKDRKPIHVTRMRRTDVEDATYCFVGFPVKSVEKYIPKRETFESIDDKHVVITIALPTPTDGSDVTFERLKEAVEKWKENYEIKVQKPKKEKPSAAPGPMAVARPTGAGILAQIMSYPLAEHTAVDNIAFISSLKNQITAIL